MSGPDKSDTPFGVHEFLSWDHSWNNHHYDALKLEKALALMQEAGVGWVRMDFLWADLEPHPGEFDFAKYDRLVSHLEKARIKILATLAYAPFWHRAEWNAAPEPTLFRRWVQVTSNRFKNRIHHWEIWHEPDNPRFWQPQDGNRAYVELLKEATAAIKQEDGSAKVHLGGLSHGLPASLKAIYAHGGREYFDAVNIHPFIHPLMPDALGGLRYFYESAYRVMQQNGDSGKPLWFTAIGAPGLEEPRRSLDWWLGKNPTELQQAEWVRRLYTDVVRWPGVSKIFWSFFRDTPGHFGNGTDYCGLVRNDFSKKPAFEAYREIASPTVVL